MFLEQKTIQQGASIVFLPRADTFSFLDVLMVDGGRVKPWNTEDINNTKKLVGIVIQTFDDSYKLVRKGAFRTNLPDGIYFCNSLGKLTTVLGPSSFIHEVGRVESGWFIINELVVPSLASDLTNTSELTNDGSSGQSKYITFEDILAEGKLWFTNTPPAGWLILEGQEISRTTYADLFSILGETYGPGDGSTTFELPDFRGRFPFGKAVSGTGDTLGSGFGAIDHDHTVEEENLNTENAGGHNHGGSTGSAGAHNHGGSTGNTGSQAVGLLGLLSSAAPSNHSHTISSQPAHSHSIASASDHNHGFSIPERSTSANNPPGMPCNVIIRVLI